MSYDTERFILEIKNRPCLWDSASKEYADRNLKIKSWDDLVNIFQDKEKMSYHKKQQMSVALQKKWKSIRGCFTRELSRQKNLKSGTVSGSRKSEYIFFQQLQFLVPVVSIKEPEQVVDEVSVESVEKDKEVHCLKRKKTNDSIIARKTNKLLETLNRRIKLIERLEANDYDEDRHFLLSLVGALKSLPADKKMIVKMEMMSLLENATRYIESPKPYVHSYQLSHLADDLAYRSGCSDLSSSVQSPVSNSSNHSEESSILGINEMN